MLWELAGLLWVRVSRSSAGPRSRTHRYALTDTSREPSFGSGAHEKHLEPRTFRVTRSGAKDLELDGYLLGREHRDADMPGERSLAAWEEACRTWPALPGKDVERVP